MRFFKKKHILPIKIYGNPVLRKKAIKVDQIDEKLISLIDSMIDTMYEADGVGLAAPQIGESIRLVVLAVPYDEGKNILTSPGEAQLLPRMPLALINPEVQPITEETSTQEEGCLSVPKIYAEVTRPTSIMLSAQLIDGQHINIECGGFLARALQHEFDHLNGTLFVDRLSPLEKRKIKRKLELLKKGNKR